MRFVNRLSSLYRNLFRSTRVERDLDEEVRAYATLLAEEKMRSGLSAAEARREASMELGGVEQVKVQVREVQAGAFLQTIAQDVRQAGRAMLKNRGFTTIALLALALGIGANSAIFSVMYGVLLRPLPYADAGRVALVYLHFLPQNSEHGTLSIADYLDWKSQNTAFEDPQLYTHSGFRFDISGPGEAEQVSGCRVTAGFFTVLGASALLGRTFQPGDDSAAGQRLVVLSEALWRRHFGANRQAVGQAIPLNGALATVIGVMPAAFRFPPDSELWTNIRLATPTRRGPFPFIGIGRLKAGVSIEHAQAETNRIGARIEQRNPGNYKHLTMPVLPLREALVGGVRPALLALFAAVVLVLLIATMNVANLLLARSKAREREMAIRASLGATQARLVRQLLTESSLLALVGGALGLALAYGGIHLLQAWNPGNLPRIEDIQLDARVLAFTLLTSLLSGVLFGLAPVSQSTRRDLAAPLKDGARGTIGSTSRRRVDAALVIAQMALSLVLLAGAGLLLRSFITLKAVDPGFHAPTRQVLTMQISATGNRYAKESDGVAFQQRLMDAVRNLPGVEAVAVSDGLPPDHQADYDTFQIEGQPWTESTFPAVTATYVSADYFRVLGVPLIQGRYFDRRDALDAPPVIAISESLARHYFSGQDPVGRRMKVSGPDTNNPWMEIVGVVGDVKYTGLDENSAIAYYAPASQSFNPRTFLLVRSAMAPSIAPEVRRKIHELDRDVTVTGVNRMDQVIANSVAGARFRAYLIAIFAILALGLASIGIYGVVSYSVAQRTSEIGIRAAMGARPVDILRMVTREGLHLTLIGLAAGIAIALTLTHLMSGLLFGISATDFGTFAAVSALLCLVALLACLIPARRAMRVDPIVALRSE